MARVFSALVFGLLIAGVGVLMACGAGGNSEKPGERITDPARVPSSTPVQNPTLFKIKGNEVTLTGGTSGAITPVAQSTPPATDYTIKSGDFCSTIASEHKLTLDEFLKANRTIDCNALRIGDKVKIPAPLSAATPTRGAITGNATVRPGTTGTNKSYTVEAGDTCSGIAANHGVSLGAFLSANPSIDATCGNLDAGDIVTIP